MKDLPNLPHPRLLDVVSLRSRAIGFGMPSDEATGGLLRCLVSSKPRSRILELGTGTGLGCAWLLDGMDSGSVLDTVELNQTYQAIARDVFESDKRVRFFTEDGLTYLEQAADESYDFIFADTWPGKYIGFSHTLRILRKGGLIFLDDMLPQPNWPSDHPPKVEKLISEIDALPRSLFHVSKLCWFTGHIIITKRA